MERSDWLSVAAQAEIEGNDPLAEFYRKLAQADRADAERTRRLVQNANREAGEE